MSQLTLLKPMGQAIRKQFLDSETPAALAFVAWVRRLFTIQNI